MDFPKYQARVDHPVYGWQVVAVATSHAAIVLIAEEWIGSFDSVELYEIHPTVKQCWTHLGTVKFEDS